MWHNVRACVRACVHSCLCTHVCVDNAFPIFSVKTKILVGKVVKYTLNLDKLFGRRTLSKKGMKVLMECFDYDVLLAK